MQLLPWILFSALILILVSFDLFIFHRGNKKPTVPRALLFSSIWIGISLLFNLWVYVTRDTESALNFFAGYLIEKSLSLDNLFVFLLIFNYFQIESRWRHKVLFWGILGALVLRAVFIIGGVVLVNKFDWILYVFGLFLMISAIKLAKDKDKEMNPENNWAIIFLKKWFPVTHENPKGAFLVRKNGVTYVTTLLLALVSVETTDVIFALDSIPAIFAITRDPFIIYTSNIFAILGLRSLYFAIDALLELFHHLHYGLSFILFMIGTKMLLKDIIHFPIYATLSLIILALGISIVASLYYPKKGQSSQKTDSSTEKQNRK